MRRTRAAAGQRLQQVGGAPVGRAARPAAAPGAAPRRPGRRGARGSPARSRSPTSGTDAGGAQRRPLRRIADQRQQPPAPGAAAAATRRPTSPQPTISSVGRRARVGVEKKAIGMRAESRVSLRAPFRCLSPSPCSPAAAPSASIATNPSSAPRSARASACRTAASDGACGSCKCRLLEGRVIHGAHQAKALSAEEEAAGLDPDLPGRAADRRRPRGAHRPGRRRVRDPQDAVPRDPHRASRRRDVAILHLQLPANDPLRYHAGQYVEFILQGGARRSYSMANAPHTQGEQARRSSCTCGICRAASSPTTCSGR